MLFRQLKVLSDEEIDLKERLRRGASREDIKRLIEEAVASKPGGHRLRQGFTSGRRPMAQIGG